MNFIIKKSYMGYNKFRFNIYDNIFIITLNELQL